MMMSLRHYDKENPEVRNREKKKVLLQIIALAVILGIMLASTTYALGHIFPPQYVMYFHVAEVAGVGLVIIFILGNITYNYYLSASSRQPGP